MTFEEMLEYPGQVAQLTDAELLATLAPFFPMTRPADLSTMATATDESDMDPTVAAELARIRAAKAAAKPPTFNLLKKPAPPLDPYKPTT